jgi:hypothetical protein
MGDSSIYARGTWRVGNSLSPVIKSEVGKKHTAGFTKEKFLESIEKTIFAEWEKIPQELCKLMMQDITPDDCSTKTPAGVEQNAVALYNAIEDAFKRLEIMKAVGQKMTKKLKKVLMDTIPTTEQITKYDLCMHIMELPHHYRIVNGGKRDNEKLQKACSNAPFIAYESATLEAIAE